MVAAAAGVDDRLGAPIAAPCSASAAPARTPHPGPPGCSSHCSGAVHQLIRHHHYSVPGGGGKAGHPRRAVAALTPQHERQGAAALADDQVGSPAGDSAHAQPGGRERRLLHHPLLAGCGQADAHGCSHGRRVAWKQRGERGERREGEEGARLVESSMECFQLACCSRLLSSHPHINDPPLHLNEEAEALLPTRRNTPQAAALGSLASSSSSHEGCG